LIDRAKIYVKGGDGGNGTISFRREKFVPFGGPDGGDGGDGGSVYVEGNSSITTLRRFRYKKHFRAERGTHGKGKNMHGRNGEDLVIGVPLGTVVHRESVDGSREMIADIVEKGQRALVAEGGKGGHGNTHFASPTNQAPRTSEQGKPGEEATILLDLKLIADVGIIGYPNAGKSTLVSTVSRARPKIADYPFTTLEPVLGVVEMDYKSFVIADIPGIIEGAHTGAGLGLDFLRHIERTKVLIQIIDGTSETIIDDARNIEVELGSYEVDLSDRPRIIAVNKIDIPEVRERLPEFREELKDFSLPVSYISAATGEGTEVLMKKALELVLQSEERRPVSYKGEEETEFKVFRPRPLSPRKKGRRREKNG
jgi:GTP-binding protein